MRKTATDPNRTQVEQKSHPLRSGCKKLGGLLSGPQCTVIDLRQLQSVPYHQAKGTRTSSVCLLAFLGEMKGVLGRYIPSLCADSRLWPVLT